MSLSYRVSKKVQEEYEDRLAEKGSTDFYRHIIGSAIINIGQFDTPEEYYLNQSEAFVILYRQTGNGNYLDISRILRRAAHRLYRQYMRMHMREKNDRFLNLVKCGSNINND